MIACVGDVMVDVFYNPDGSTRTHPGGKASNYAGVAKVLGAEASVIGAIGKDDWGRQCFDAIKQLGVDVSGLVILPNTPTGADFFEGDDWRIERGANWLLTAEHVTKALTEQHRRQPLEAIIVNQGISSSASEAAIRFARENGIFLALNLAPEAVEPERKIDASYYRDADLIVVNQIEGEVLHEHQRLSGPTDNARALSHQLYSSTQPRSGLVLTLGPSGAVVAMKQDGRTQVANIPPQAAPIDETEYFIGAGDATLAALVTKLLPVIQESRDLSLPQVVEAMHYGMAVAAASLQYPGTMTAALTPSSQLRALTLGPDANAGIGSRSAAD